MVFGEARERAAPVSDACFGPAVELLGCFGAVRGQHARVEGRNRVHAPRRVLEPGVPEGTRIPEDAVEVERELHDRSLDATTSPTATPSASIATATGDACRPDTNGWWSSSLIA